MKKKVKPTFISEYQYAPAFIIQTMKLLYNRFFSIYLNSLKNVIKIIHLLERNSKTE